VREQVFVEAQTLVPAALIPAKASNFTLIDQPFNLSV